MTNAQMSQISNLNKLFSSITNLNGVGEKSASLLNKIGVNRIADLLLHLPYNILEYKKFPDIKSLQHRDNVILQVQAINVTNRKKICEILCQGENFFLKLLYFNYYPNYLISRFKSDKPFIVCGIIDKSKNDLRISHPEKIIEINQQHLLPTKEIIYYVTPGLTAKQISKYVQEALHLLPNVEEWLDEDLISQHNWLSFIDSMKLVHNPDNMFAIENLTKEKTRLAFDELLAHQLAINIARKLKTKDTGRSFQFNDNLQEKILTKLGFTLTNGQKTVLDDIVKDQQSLHKMSRLIQGDVGCGKTLVALCAMLNVIQSKQAQTCLMAPTDVLAKQHYHWLSSVTSDLDINVELLTGKITGKKRAKILDDLKNNNIDILIGTHAIFQEHVQFFDLGLIVIDEQHRFGVKQRTQLLDKGNKADLLVMSATPIPRTLTLALYGDLDLSRITDKPSGRLDIHTSMMSSSKMSQLVAAIKQKIANGDKIYWICPLIEGIEDAEFLEKNNAAVIARYNEFKEIFGDIVGLIHGKLKEAEKETAINKFATGQFKILIATTVIEVGIDIKDANIMIIENADKFGLAQLHQLRGRVGRGSIQSYCILLYSNMASKISLERLKILKSTNDGFILADEDLRIRGSGNIAGTQQSGISNFFFADLNQSYDLISIAHASAKKITNSDPFLTGEKGHLYRYLLSFFGYDISVLNS
jgi:ATP-dependent DNA helicase RecG